MATTVLCNCKVLVDGTDLSGACNEATVSYTAEMLDATTFGICTRVRKGGLTALAIALKGFYHLGSTGPDGTLWPVVGEPDRVFTFFPTTITTGSYCGYASKATVESLVPGGTVGTLTPFTASIVGNGTEV
jgi:hypothetical protein